MSIASTDLFKNIPQTFRVELIRTYDEISRNYLESRWEPSELNGGKFCEAVYSILLSELSGNYASAPAKPTNMLDACRKLEGYAPSLSRVGDHSLRILIPRLLPAIYDFRNNRGVGHIGGDVNPNEMDASAVYHLCSWILSEFVRIFHGLTTQAAQEVVSALVQRKLPLIWQIESTKRVLDTSLSAKDQVLLLMYQSVGWTSVDELNEWIEYSNKSVFKKSVLSPMHNHRLIEFHVTENRAKISPKGVEYVEKNLLTK